jgi:limonene-1,2-epoxide hydrolase
MDNVKVITDFVNAWSRLDAAELASYFTADGCYYNMPTQPIRGQQEVQRFISGFTANWTATQWDIVSIAGAGDTVYCERLDRTQSKTGNVDLPCLGVFEMQDGKIKEWRDYFDLQTFMQGIAGDA